MLSGPETFFTENIASLSLDKPLVLGFSGGGDSLSLLQKMVRFAKPADVPVYALIVNHRMKPGADAEALRAAKLAGDLGALAQVLPWQGAPLRGHAQARLARYRLLAAACQTLGADRLLLAHTLDDQVETFFLRILAGSKARGLAVMGAEAPYPIWPEGHGLRVCRPMLKFNRADLRKTLQDAGLCWIDDPSNLDQRYARVRMRSRLAGLFANGLNQQTVRFVIQQMQNLEQAVQGESQSALEQWVEFDPAGYARMDQNLTNHVPPRVLARVLERVMSCVSGRQRCKHRGPVLNKTWDELINMRRALTRNGCQMLMDKERVLVVRDKGAIGGRKNQPVCQQIVQKSLAPLWYDQRWLIHPPATGVILPVLSCEQRLNEAQVQKLTELPASVRATLPVLVRDNAPAIVLPVEAPRSILFTGCTRGMETGTRFA